MTNPAPISSAADFKARKPTGIPFTLPSGLTCAVKRPGITELLAEGLFPDSLMGMVGAFVDKGQGKKPADRKKTKEQQAKIDAKNSEDAMNTVMQEIVGDPEKLRDMLLTVDKATVYCVVEPQVHMNRYPDDHKDEALRGQIIPPSDRDEELLYVDNIDEDDRMEIFNFAVGGDSAEQVSAAKFLEARGDVEPVQDGEDVVVPTKRTSGGKKRA